MPALSVGRFSARTLPALLLSTAKRVLSRAFVYEIDPDRPEDEPAPRSFAEFERRVALTAEALAALGVSAGDRVLLFAENSLDWQVVSFATQALRAEPAAAFSNLGTSAICEIARAVKPRCILVSSAEKWQSLAGALPELIAAGLSLRLSPRPLAETDPNVLSRTTQELAEGSFDARSWSERVQRVGPDDPCLLVFTSGTSGRPKGVRLSQESFVRALDGGHACTRMTELDHGLMFLPFAHVAGQCQFALAVALGHSLILAARREHLQRAFELGPTYLFAVPMVYEKLRQRVQANVAGTPRPLRDILGGALAAASRHRQSQDFTRRERWLRLLARKTIGRQLRRKLGGRLRFVASGGAAAPAELVQFFETMGIPFLSLYGMSETSGLISASPIDGPRLCDSVGLPSPDLELRIGSEGELSVRGPLLMKGYLSAEDNEVAFDADGFFRTGDIVRIESETGHLLLVGRSTDLVVLSTGKKLSPEPIEAKLRAVLPIETAVMVGDCRPYASAIVFLPAAEIERLGTEHERAAAVLLDRLRGELDEFSEYERPKRLLLVPRASTEFPELVTPTLKLKRAAILERFADAIDELYGTREIAGITLGAAESCAAW